MWTFISEVSGGVFGLFLPLELLIIIITTGVLLKVFNKRMFFSIFIFFGGLIILLLAAMPLIIKWLHWFTDLLVG